MTDAIILRRRKLGRGSANGIKQFSRTGIIPVRHWVNADWRNVSHENSIVFRWGCVASLPNGMLATVVNTAAAIHWCADKKQGRLDMQEAGVPVPKSWTAEEFELAIERNEFNDGSLFVSRPGVHAQGRNLSCNIASDVVLWAGGYVSRFIDKEHEYRVFVCQNRAVWVAKKTPGNPEDVAWNVAAGGRFDNVRWGEWPMAVIRAAMQAAKVSGTDFCGVDVMVDSDGRAYVLEVNSAPSQTSPYRQECVAKAFDYIVEKGKDHFDDPDSYSNWKKVIHPAVWSREDD